MLRKIVLFGCGLFFCFGVAAQETKILGFDQVFNLNHDELYELELQNLNPSSQLWTAFYLIGVPKSAAMNTKADFVISGEGVINKDHPANPTEVVSLVANNLPARENYSFKEFDDLVEEIEDQTGKKIQDPVLGDASNVRVYGQIIDWIPEYNLQKPAKIRAYQTQSYLNYRRTHQTQSYLNYRRSAQTQSYLNYRRRLQTQSYLNYRSAFQTQSYLNYRRFYQTPKLPKL